MKKLKILAIIGSLRKNETWKTVEKFEKLLKDKTDLDFEYVYLKEYNIQQCRGCFLCLTKGEEFCPHNDDRQLLVEKIMTSDGVIWATPNYALQVTAVMKNFLDRIAYTFHRPCFFHKRFTCIVTQGAIGGKDIVKYLKNVACYTGYIYVPGFFVTTVTPRTSLEQKTIDKKVRTAVLRFCASLKSDSSPRPSFLMLFVFRIVRSMYRATPDESLKDVRYYRENGWFKSGYFYPVRLGMRRIIVGALADFLGERFALKRKRDLAENTLEEK